jgi:Ankyrin repeats (3 copies)
VPNSQLPARPSLESLRKQAKKLTRDIVAGNKDAIARAYAHLPKAKLPLTQRDAQLVLARDYGFAGWKDLIKEVEQRCGRGLESAVSEARRIIHDNDVERLRELTAEYPLLLSWTTDEIDGGLLSIATGSFGDSGDPFREEHFTRKACAEFLLDAGAVVTPSVCEGIVRSRAKGLIDLFHRKGLFPQSLKFLAALGDLDGVRARLDANADDLITVNEAFRYACHLGHASVAAELLDRSVTLDTESGKRIGSGPGRFTFIQYLIENKPDINDSDPFRPWEVFVRLHVSRSMDDGDLASFVDLLQRNPWLLSNRSVKFQIALIDRTAATLKDRAAFLRALVDLDPAVMRTPVPSSSANRIHNKTFRAYIHAFTYAQAHLLPLLKRIWPMPEDLPHAAGSGDFTRVRHWFDAAGGPALGDLAHHFPANDDWIRRNLEWGKPSVQQVLDTALAFAVINDHFEIAGFLLDHGADINTTWSSHEPASILHELVWHKNYQAMQFLIDRGIDMTTQDYRWHATAVGWAAVAAKDEELAQWMRDAQQRREQMKA